MNNLLFVFLEQLENEEELDKIIDKFSENNYIIYILDNIKADKDFYMQQLPDLVAFYKNEHEDVNKVVVMSNVRDLLFAWYRCYNSVVDDFVYFVDASEKLYFESSDRHYNFYKNLAGFNSIDKESVEGKIYTNLSKINISKRCKHFFDTYEEIGYLESSKKQQRNKIYQFDNLNYSFTINNDIKNIQKIKLHKDIRIDNFDGNRLKIIVYKGQSRYDVLRIMADQVIEALGELGHKVFVIDLLASEWEMDLEDALSYGCDFAFSYNAMGVDITVGNQSLYDALGIPLIAAIVDHPLYLYERFNINVNNVIYLLSDRENMRFMSRENRGRRCKEYTIFGLESAASGNNNKTIELLFAGSMRRPDELRESWEQMDKGLVDCLESTINEYLRRGNVRPLTDIIDDEIKSKGLLEKYDRDSIMQILFIKGKDYIRNYFRYNLIKTIGESNISLTCYSNSVEVLKELDVNGRFDIRQPVSFRELSDIMAQSKIVLNISAQAYEGVSERVLSTLVNGAVSITDRNPFLEEIFVENEDILMYDLNNLSSVVSKVNSILKNKDMLESVSKAGKKKAEKLYSVKNFVDNVIGVFKDEIF